MFNLIFIKKLKYFIIFIIIFTVIFIIFLKTLYYTIPFIIAFVIAFCSKPLMHMLMIRLKLSKTVAALLSTFLVFSTLISMLLVLLYKITNESKELLASIPNLDSIRPQVERAIKSLEFYYSHFDPSIINKVQDKISVLISTSFDISARILNLLVSYAAKLPMLFLLIIVTLLSTYFFTKDMPDFSKAITFLFNDNLKPRIKEIICEATHMLSEYVKAYTFIITISFIEILLGFIILKIKYALILSLICWVLELIPVLGIFIVFFPLIAIYLLANKYFIGISLAILWIIVVAVRQIIEPKIVSSSLGIHPLAVLAAIFIGLTTYGFIGMAYILSALVFYKILNKVGII